MMRRKKACIIIGSFSIGIGIALTAISIAFGGFPDMASSAVKYGEVYRIFDRNSGNEIVSDQLELLEEGTSATTVETDYDGISMSWEGSQYDLQDLILEYLTIDLDHSSVEIVQGEVFQIETDVDSNIHCYLEGKELQVEEEGSWFEFSTKKGLKNNASKVKITLPPYQLAHLDISTGAGNIKISDLETEELNIDAGAGSVKANNVTASFSDFELGAGNVIIQNFLGREQTEISSGVGSVKIDGVLLNSTMIEGGVGMVDLNIHGNVNDYEIEAESGMGTVKVNGKKIASFFESRAQTNSGDNSLYVEGGVGSVDIRFTE